VLPLARRIVTARAVRDARRDARFELDFQREIAGASREVSAIHNARARAGLLASMRARRARDARAARARDAPRASRRADVLYTRGTR